MGATIGAVARAPSAEEKQSFEIIAEGIRARDRTLVHIEDDENGAAVSPPARSEPFRTASAPRPRRVSPVSPSVRHLPLSLTRPCHPMLRPRSA